MGEILIAVALMALIGEGSPRQVHSMNTRMIDGLKTGFFTSIVSSSAQNDTSGEIGVYSLIDTWIIVRELEEKGGEKRIREIYIVKSRGIGHSSDVHKLVLHDDGISIKPIETDSNPTTNPEKKATSGMNLKSNKR